MGAGVCVCMCICTCWFFFKNLYTILMTMTITQQMMLLEHRMDLRMVCGTHWRLRSRTKRSTVLLIAMSRSQIVNWPSPQAAHITLVSQIWSRNIKGCGLSCIKFHVFKLVITSPWLFVKDKILMITRTVSSFDVFCSFLNSWLSSVIYLTSRFWGGWGQGWGGG